MFRSLDYLSSLYLVMSERKGQDQDEGSVGMSGMLHVTASAGHLQDDVEPSVRCSQCSQARGFIGL